MMKLSSLLKPKSYLNKLRAFQRSFVVARLVKKPIAGVMLSKIWPVEVDISNSESSRINSFSIFGTEISLNEPINWHTDYVSGFEYPLKRFDKIKLSNWYNKGIDVKFPWEVSRFYFAVSLAQEYVKTNDNAHYELFKQHLLDWLDKNPYCYGVNWVCTMDVSIRATNWVVASCLSWKAMESDEVFQNKLSITLIQHATYIDNFTEYKGNNHDISNYAGLLFLSLFLKKHPKSKQWLNKAVGGLETNIRKQVFDDGVSFEYSTSYHRLVLEFFAYSFIVGKLHGVEFSPVYKEKLFKMFEFVAAYLNHSGLSPQVGDNDSGRFLIFHKSQCLDHTYLLNLGEHIFDYTFPAQCAKRTQYYNCWLPTIKKEKVPVAQTKDGSKSIGFAESGFYFLKNQDLNVMIIATNITKKSRVGHKHFDIGSFTISHKGVQIIIDPGTYTYTRSLNKRNYFRSIYMHNAVWFDNPASRRFTKANSFFSGNFLFPLIKVKSFQPTGIQLTIMYKGIGEIERTINVNEKNCVVIEDSIADGPICASLNIRDRLTRKHNTLWGKNVVLTIEGNFTVLKDTYSSSAYGVVQKEISSIKIQSKKPIKHIIEFAS